MHATEQDVPPPANDTSIPENPDDPRTTGNGGRGAPGEAEGFNLPACWAIELGDPSEEPPREVWLLRDNLTGKPALPIGRAALLAAAGGTGKTTTLAQLSVAVVLGLVWAGLSVQTPGRVVLAVAESDRKLVRRHLYRACNSFGLSREQRIEAMRQILVLPLAGHEVNLLRGTAGNEVERTEFLAKFRAHLATLATEGGFGWSLVVLDPLSRFAGPDTEVDNAAATRFVQAVETLLDLPGSPAVLVTHHSSKLSIRSGANDARGVSGLRDAFRAVWTLTKARADGLVGVLLHCDKANDAPEFCDRWLVRNEREPLPDGGWLDIGGTLRLATDEEAELLGEAAATRKKSDGRTGGPAPVSDATLEQRLLSTLAKHGGAMRSRTRLVDATEGTRAKLLEVIRSLVQRGRLVVMRDGSVTSSGGSEPERDSNR